MKRKSTAIFPAARTQRARATYDAPKGRVISQAGDESRLGRNSEFESVSVIWTKKADE
jgi:hypothetical protein